MIFSVLNLRTEIVWPFSLRSDVYLQRYLLVVKEEEFDGSSIEVFVVAFYRIDRTDTVELRTNKSSHGGCQSSLSVVINSTKTWNGIRLSCSVQMQLSCFPDNKTKYNQLSHSLSLSISGNIALQRERRMCVSACAWERKKVKTKQDLLLQLTFVAQT